MVPPTHSMSATDQARWVGQLTGEARHSVTSHLLMLIRLITLTYLMVLPLFLQRREIMTKIQLAVSSSHGRQGHSLPQGYPPPNTSKPTLQTTM